MEPENISDTPKFVLLGLSDDPALQPVLFGLFLSMYLVTVLGNLLIVLAVSADSRLHTPMYFFLSSLSLTDICISTTTIPKMLVNIHTQGRSITYTGCLSQICSVLIFGGLENCLLAVMASDRYVAVCHPLRYTAIMKPHLCVLLVLLSLLTTAVNALPHGVTAPRLSFCADLTIPHFFCELAQVLTLSCSDTFSNYLLMYLGTALFAGVPFSGVIFSYTHIVSSILRVSSVGGRCKAFSACGSHLSVVSLFYGTGLGVYLSSAVTDSAVENSVASMMYIVIPQMLNPFIYSLRNREMKESLRRLILGSPSAL